MKIQDFNQFRDVTIIQPVRTGIIFPPFTFPAVVWTGASELVAEAYFGKTQYFSMKLPFTSFGTDFILAVRWTDPESGVYFRYKFWDDEDGLLYCPTYAGESIGPNAVFEIWSINSTGNPSLTLNVTKQSSFLIFPPNTNCSACCQQPDGSLLLAFVAAPAVPAGAGCDPFCPDDVPTPPSPEPAWDEWPLSDVYEGFYLYPSSSYAIVNTGDVGVVPTQNGQIDESQANFWKSLLLSELADPANIYEYTERHLAWVMYPDTWNLRGDFYAKYATGSPVYDVADLTENYHGIWFLTYCWR